MKNIAMIISLAGLTCWPALALGTSAEAPINPCLGCHETATPAIVRQWQASKHDAVGVKCYVCHYAQADEEGREHNGYRVVAAVPPEHCGSCHPRQAEEFRESGHHGSVFALPVAAEIGPGTGKSPATCATCHRGHTFDLEQPRQPATCGQCHPSVNGR